MILPRTRLLWWTGGWLIPLAVLAAVATPAAGLIWAVAAIAMLVPVFDAVLSGRVLAGLEIDTTQVARLTKADEGDIEIRIAAASPAVRRVRLAVPLPAELGCDECDVEINLPRDVRWSSYTFTCRPTRRGRYEIDACYLGSRSPLGFWLRRRTAEIHLEVRVYPNLKADRKRLPGLFLTRGGVGIHVQRQVGQGHSFEKLRDYIPGDSYSDIHWKATAKRGRPVTKVYQIERTQEVYVVIDSSRLSARVLDTPDDADAAETTSLERFINTALILAVAAERQGDLFGLVTFSDRVENFVRARGGKGHYRACRDALYALQPKTVSPDFSEVFSLIRMRLRRRALLVFLTNLDDPILAENFADSIPLIARQHLVLVNMVQPAGVAPVFSDPNVDSVEGIYRGFSGHLQWYRLREFQMDLQHRGIQFRLLESESFCPQIVAQYVSVKQRQLI